MKTLCTVLAILIFTVVCGGLSYYFGSIAWYWSSCFFFLAWIVGMFGIVNSDLNNSPN